MPQEERYGKRCMAYSAWHRRKSTGRYVGIEQAQLLAMIDIDVPIYMEYDDETKEPVALIEVAQDVGQHKPSTVTANLCRRAKLPGFVALYTLDDKPNPADPAEMDILKFRVKRLWPCPEKENGWRPQSPREWAETLLKVRKWQGHELDKELFGDEQPF